jgi:hypothetical protein
MPLSRSRKLSQPPGTHMAINAAHCVDAEPQSPTAFTYLQIHAQVVHHSLSRRTSPPASLGFFSGRDGLTQVAGKRRRHPAELSMAPSVKLRHSSVVTQCGVVPWEKSKPSCIASPPPATCSCGRSSFIEMRLLTSVCPFLESLKTIAFDKISVNTDFSSGNLFSYIPI